MPTTPYVSPIKKTGSFYVFNSAKEDYNYSIANPNKKFKFSKFVLLDIPDIKDQSTGINATGIDKQPSSFLTYKESDWNISFMESFQNYCLNLETMLLSRPEYDQSKPLTISERVFWKWLKELGAIRYREAKVGNPEDGGERLRRTENNALVNDPTKRAEVGKRFVEEDDNADTSGGKLPYGKIVKYIGNIDIVNSVKSSDSYTQIYIYIPEQVGSTPTVLFKSITDDDNYRADIKVTHKPTDPLNSEYLYGRNYTDTHPSGIDIRATFDSDTDTFATGTVGVDNYTMSIKKLNEGSYETGWWFSNPDADTYFLEPEKLNDCRNDKLKLTGFRNSVSTTKEFIRSRLDGVTIDFDLAKSYSDNVSGTYRYFEEYNSSLNSKDFQFNAVLVYYDLVDDIDPNNTVTNLYGVYFLNSFTDTLSGGGTIERLKKFKPNTTLGQNGNGLGFTINTFLDLNGDNTTIKSFVNEYNNFSMQLFLEALQNMSKANSSLISTINQINILNEKIDGLEDLVLTSENLDVVNKRIETLETALDTSKSLLENNKDIISLINRNYDEIVNIYRNNTSLNMAYNLDVIKEGYGIEIDRTITNKIKIKNSIVGYTLPSKPRIYFSDMTTSKDGSSYYYRAELKYGENYLKVYSDSSDNTKTMNFNNGESLIIYIDDTNTKWERGTKFKISFGSKYVFGGNVPGSIEIRTDAKNTLKEVNSFSKVIYKMTSVDVNSKNGKPTFEIICIDPTIMDFEIDI